MVNKIIIPGSAGKGSYMEIMPGGKHDPQFLVRKLRNRKANLALRSLRRDPLRQWAADHLEPVAAPRLATTCTLIKKAAANVLGLGERSPQLQVAMRAAGFTLNCVCSGGSKARSSRSGLVS